MFHLRTQTQNPHRLHIHQPEEEIHPKEEDGYTDVLKPVYSAAHRFRMNTIRINTCCRQRYIDTCPDVAPAGKLIPVGDSAQFCLLQGARPPTPPVIKKFRNSKRPEPGVVRVLPGKANDPNIASGLIHGLSNNSSPATAESLLHPPKRTVFRNKLEELNESVYKSVRKAPLGKSHDQRKGLPACYNDRTTFGVPVVLGMYAGDIINPSKTLKEVEREADVGHQNYVRSHRSYYVGEPINRNYVNHFSKDNRFGIVIPHCNYGARVGKSLHWVGEPRRFCNPKPDWTRSGTGEKLQPENGKANKLRRKSLNFPPDHSFGVYLPRDEFGVAELIHRVEPGIFLRDPDQQRSLVCATQHNLKRLNHHNFPSLLQAFRHYDKKGKGAIDREDLEDVCRHFKLNVNAPVLDDLMDYCDTDKDGQINFQEFANFLNWKDNMPINTEDQGTLTQEHRTHTAPANMERGSVAHSQQAPDRQALIKDEDMEPLEPDSFLKTPRTLRKIGNAPGHFFVTSSQIGAYADAPCATDVHACGIPSVRADIPAPPIRGVCDTTNYGDTFTAGDLLYPTVYTFRSVHEDQLLSPRPKEQILEIFRNVCANLSEETFEEAWQQASTRKPDEGVSVKVFREVLNEMKAF